MSRPLTVAVLAALEAAKNRPRLFVSIDLAASTLRFTSARNDVSWDGHTWTGAANLIGYQSPQEGLGLEARGFTVTIGGTYAANIAAILVDARQGRPVKVWRAFFDDTFAVIADPYPLAAGRYDHAQTTRSGEDCAIQIFAESRFIDMLRPRNSRYTPEDQKRRFPGDRGFDFVPAMQGRRRQWGTPYVSPSIIYQPEFTGGGG